jgi:hypothetical protein
MVESFANFIEFLILFPILINLFFLGKAPLGQLSYLNLVVGSVEELPFVLFKANS